MPLAHAARKAPARRRVRSRRRSNPRRLSRLTPREMFECLRSPDIWPDKPRSVSVIETHLSWVFLTSRFAWNMKKPVRHAGSDLRSIGARERDCRREFTLNRRLAPNVYLAVVPLTRDRADSLAASGSGRVVDWLVQMRRLPASRMLDCMLRALRQVRRICAPSRLRLPPSTVRCPDWRSTARVICATLATSSTEMSATCATARLAAGRPRPVARVAASERRPAGGSARALLSKRARTACGATFAREGLLRLAALDRAHAVLSASCKHASATLQAADGCACGITRLNTSGHDACRCV